MCEISSETKREGELYVLQGPELEALLKRVKGAGKKETVKAADDCCEPFCSPITCGTEALQPAERKGLDAGSDFAVVGRYGQEGGENG